MKKVIIFDMDGTLVDSSLTIARAINHVRNRLGLTSLDEKEILEKVNDPSVHSALHFYETDTFTPNQEEWFADYYHDHHKEELRLYDGIKELLHELKDEGFKLAVATNSYRVSTQQSLSHLQILSLFDKLACYDDVPQGKPHPDMLFQLLDAFQIEAKEALFIGDSERDAEASKSAKIDYLMVNWGFSDHADAIENIATLKEKILEA